MESEPIGYDSKSYYPTGLHTSSTCHGISEYPRMRNSVGALDACQAFYIPRYSSSRDGFLGTSWRGSYFRVAIVEVNINFRISKQDRGLYTSRRQINHTRYHL